MPIRIVPYESQHSGQVREFNRRLTEAGSAPFLLAENAPAEASPIARACGVDFHHFLAVDETGAVRGGYFIRTQPVWIQNRIYTVGHYTSPLSEGIREKRYAAVGPMLLSHALKVQPLLFAMGMGGLHNPLPRMLKGMGWTVREVPFFFYVLNGSNFFRHLGPLHTSPARSLFANVLAITGMGHLGVRMVHRARTRLSRNSGFEIDRPASFEAWADEAWEQTRDHYSFSALRDAHYLQFLYPPSPESHTIRVNEAGKTRGWVQVMQCNPLNRSYFGEMRVMALLDGVSARSTIPSLISAVIEEGKRENFDLIFSNQMHENWTAGLRSRGFLQGPSNYLLAFSKPLMELLEPFSETELRIHFNRGDGDGRVNLTR